MVKLIITAILLSCLFLFRASPGISAEIYKWKGKDGNVFFSDTPPPPGVDLGIKNLKEDPTDRPKNKEEIPRPQNSTLRQKRSYGNINVIMYMTSWCGYCKKARAYINSLNVHLTEYDIEKDKSKREEMMQKSGGATGVPVIDVEGIIIKGYSSDAIRAAIEKRRSL